jgi:hypothetical protein
VNALTASLAFEHAADGIRVNAVATGGTEAPERRVPRNPAKQTEQEVIWYQGIVDQTKATSLMHRYGTIVEQVGAILFLASDEASYVTGTVLPVGGGDQGRLQMKSIQRRGCACSNVTWIHHKRAVSNIHTPNTVVDDINVSLAGPIEPRRCRHRMSLAGFNPLCS